MLKPVGTFSTGAFDEGASEIVGFDGASARAFVVNAQAGTVDVLDISDVRSPNRVAQLATPGANSVAVKNGLVAVATQAEPSTAPGSVRFFDAASLAPRGAVTVGALPDMVTFTRDGETVLVANEGEPSGYEAGDLDPAGSVSVISLGRGPRDRVVRTAGFTKYDGRERALRRAGIRIFGPGASASRDLEPEYIAVGGRSKKAFVTLQENNALAIIDIEKAKVSGLESLGTKNHRRAGNGLDASDEDGDINIARWPVRGLYMPDAIDRYRARGRAYLVTANEGDAREYDGFAEEARVEDLTLDPAAFPDAAALQQDEALGRLNVTKTSPRGPDGYTELHSFGARSATIREADGRLVWDSGDMFEHLVAAESPGMFNFDNTENASFDSRSDNKGPEPEGLDLGKVRGRTYAFVGFERVSAIAAVDVTNPRSARLAGYGSNRDGGGDPAAGTAGDLGPEGILFIRPKDSPTRRPLLLVGNEVSGTTTVWSIR